MGITIEVWDQYCVKNWHIDMDNFINLRPWQNTQLDKWIQRVSSWVFLRHRPYRTYSPNCITYKGGISLSYITCCTYEIKFDE